MHTNETIKALKAIQVNAAAHGNTPDIPDGIASAFYDIIEDIGDLIKAIEEQA